MDQEQCLAKCLEPQIDCPPELIFVAEFSNRLVLQLMSAKQDHFRIKANQLN